MKTFTVICSKPLHFQNIKNVNNSTLNKERAHATVLRNQLIQFNYWLRLMCKLSVSSEHCHWSYLFELS